MTSLLILQIFYLPLLLFSGRFFLRWLFIFIFLQGNDKGKGLCDGKFGSERHFTCSKNCGIFAPFTNVRPRDPKPQESPKPLQDPAGTLVLGDRVTFFLNDDSSRNGMVLALEGNVVVISPVSADLVTECEI